MKEKINQLLKDIEKEKNIKILFAVENGSRAWRMASSDSDYDIRFVFVRPVEEYLQINIPGDVIDKHYDKEGNPQSAQGCVFDMSGFDIFKFVKLLSSSNPTVIEWLMTDIVYYGEQNEVFKQFALKNFNKISLYHHYKSMCRQNYLKYLKSGDKVTYKKYLYAMRGLINAKWVVVNRKIPPIDFKEALENIRESIPESIIDRLLKIIELKKDCRENKIIENIPHIDSFIEDFLKDDSDAPTEKPHATLNELNTELRKIILGR